MGRILMRVSRWGALMRLDREDRDGLTLGVLTLVLMVLIDLCYHGRANFSGSFVLAPVLAAALASPVIVAAIGVLSVVAAAAMSVYEPSGAGTAVRLVVVAVAAAIGVFTSRHRRQLTDRTIRLRSIADAAESALLRPLPGRVGPASMAGWHVTATTEARVGGDFYEAVPFRNRARWVIGDARGHGVEAIRLGAAAVGAFREAASRLESLEEVAHRVEESLLGFLGDEDFVTAIFAEMAQDGTLVVINCGHPVPYLLRPGVPEPVPCGGTTPLGIEPDLFGRVIRLSKGDSLCFRTDGLDEVRTARGRGVEMEPLGEGLGGSSPEEAAQLIRERLLAEVGVERYEDDVSVVVVRYEPLADVSSPHLRPAPGAEPAGDQPGIWGGRGGGT